MLRPRPGFLAGTVISAALALAVLAPASALAGPAPAGASLGQATAGACVPGANLLCLNNSRFAVSVEWRDFQGNTGPGKAIPLTADTGYFWFFTNTNVELVVKVLDAAAINGHFWVFYGALSNVEYTITVTDTATSEQKIYTNPSGEFGSAGDTLAFASSVGSAPAAASALVEAEGSWGLGSSSINVIPAASRKAQATGCVADATGLCLAAGRFRVEVNWKDFQGKTGRGQAIGLTADTGYFWFFNSANVELVVKVLDARGVNGNFWAFYGALSNVEYEIVVIDTETGESRRYKNPSGDFASAGDTAAFPLAPGTPLPAITGVGTPDGQAASASIGVSGGALTSPDGGLTLSVPPGAVAGAVNFTIQPITNQAPGGIGSAYRLTPDGQTFAVPASITFHYGDQDLAGSAAGALAIAYQDNQHFWRSPISAVLDEANKTLTVSTSHLTDWSKLLGWQLDPATASVSVGKTKLLTLIACVQIDVGDELSTLSGKCFPDPEFVDLYHWAVNGAPGGTTGTGTVRATSDTSATFTAPGTRPTPSEVTVSAEIYDAERTVLLISKLTIVEDQWRGTTSSSLVDESISGTTELVWILESSVNKVSRYRSSGTATMFWKDCTIAPDHGEVNPLGILTVDFNNDPPTYSGTAAAFWPAHFSCKDLDPFDGPAEVLSFDAEGTVSSDGRIEGAALSGDGVWTINWSLTRE